MFYGYDIFLDVYRFQGEDITVSKTHSLVSPSFCFITPVPEFIWNRNLPFYSSVLR